MDFISGSLLQLNFSLIPFSSYFANHVQVASADYYYYYLVVSVTDINGSG